MIDQPLIVPIFFLTWDETRYRLGRRQVQRSEEVEQQARHFKEMEERCSESLGENIWKMNRQHGKHLAFPCFFPMVFQKATWENHGKNMGKPWNIWHNPRFCIYFFLMTWPQNKGWVVPWPPLIPIGENIFPKCFLQAFHWSKCEKTESGESLWLSSSMVNDRSFFLYCAILRPL